MQIFICFHPPRACNVGALAGRLYVMAAAARRWPVPNDLSGGGGTDPHQLMAPVQGHSGAAVRSARLAAPHQPARHAPWRRLCSRLSPTLGSYPPPRRPEHPAPITCQLTPARSSSAAGSVTFSRLSQPAVVRPARATFGPRSERPDAAPAGAGGQRPAHAPATATQQRPARERYPHGAAQRAARASCRGDSHDPRATPRRMPTRRHTAPTW